MRSSWNKTHGRSGSREYNIWYDMRRRCSDHLRVAYPDYGGRGITYDPKWQTFEGFWEDMGEGYEDHLTLERKDTNGNYSKENCKWVEKKEQARNKRAYKNNSTSSPNILYLLNKGVPSIRARVQNPENGKRASRTYSLIKYSEECALELANMWIKNKRQEFGYSESHGT